MSRLIVAGLTLLCSVLGLLGAAAWNRAEQRQVMTLTERELSLPFTWENGAEDDDAELRLRLGWVERDDPLDARNWLTDDRLMQLGFSLGVIASAPEAARFYTRAVSRLGWVAFEYEGPAWRAKEAQRETTREVERSRWTGVERSRLVPIDAALDRETLASRFRDQRVLILPAVFDIRWVNRPGGAVVWGRLESVVPQEVSVPTSLRDRLRGFGQPRIEPQPDRSATVAPPVIPPRYDVDVAVGRLGTPWVLDVRRR
jgi:hypothetical protein